MRNTSKRSKTNKTNKRSKKSKSIKISKLCGVIMIMSGALFLAGTSLAKNLGSQGQTFVVKEQDFRVFIQDRLAHLQQTGALKAYEKAAQHRVRQAVYHPQALDLKTQTQSQTFFVDPSVRLNRAITDQTGRVLVRAGTVVNPFKTVHLASVLLFFNGDDPAQVRWVQAHYRDYRWVKFILTGGDLRQAANQFGRIYYDQHGLLTKKLHITHVPAIAQQAGLKWKITVIGSQHFE